MVGGQPAGVDGGTGTANDAAQLSSQLLSQLDAALDILGDATAHRDDHVSADQIDQLLGGLDDLDHLGLHVVLSQRDGGLDQLAGVSLGLIELSLLHHAGAHSGR